MNAAFKNMIEEHIKSVEDNVYLTNEIIYLKQTILDIREYLAKNPLLNKDSMQNKIPIYNSLRKLETEIERGKIKLEKYEEKLKLLKDLRKRVLA